MVILLNSFNIKELNYLLISKNIKFNENEIPEIFASNFSLNQSNFIECSRNYENWHILENEDISLSSFFQPPKIIDFDIKNKKNANQISENLSKDTSNIIKPLLPKKRINKETN